jgi:serine/threonine-protein kinase
MAKVPDRIGKYKVEELIAEGGMGAVYRGIHPTLESPVILKKLTLRGNQDFVERFRREARLLMGFRNDNIVDVYDHFKEGRSHYIVLEYIDGLSLEQLIRRERYLPNDLALYIFFQACKALKYAHSKNVVHRDIKPANLLLSREGEVKLVDFGIATSEAEAEQGLTRDGMTLGSPSYMAPEQFENSRYVDERADIYSLGVMLYEMVTGKKPYPGGFSAELVHAIQRGKYAAPQRFNPKVSRLVRRIIRRTVHPRRKRRYRDVGRLLELLRRRYRDFDTDRYRQRLRDAVRGAPLEPLRRRKGRLVKRTALAAVLALVLLSAAAAGFYASGYSHRWFQPERYGAVTLRVHLQDSYKGAENYYLRAWLFTDTGEGAEETDLKPVSFHRAAAESLPGLQSLLSFGGRSGPGGPGTSGGRAASAGSREAGGPDGAAEAVFSSRTLYLPPEEYRIKLQVENTLYWKSFDLEPRAVQRENLNTRGGRVLEFHHSAERALPLAVDIYVQDRESWENITPRTRVEVEIDGKWRRWSRETAEVLRTGNVYRFRFSAPGYRSKVFSLLIRPDQHTLYLNPRLTPRD